MFRTKRKVTLQQPEKPHVYTVPRGIMHCINHSDFTVVIIRMFTVSVPDSLSCSILLSHPPCSCVLATVSQTPSQFFTQLSGNFRLMLYPHLRVYIVHPL